jgi:hypothetical protein
MPANYTKEDVIAAFRDNFAGSIPGVIGNASLRVVATCAVGQGLAGKDSRNSLRPRCADRCTFTALQHELMREVCYDATE